MEGQLIAWICKKLYLKLQGIYSWQDGRRYEGGWKDSNMHGKGKYTWKDGRYFEGEYYNDKKVHNNVLL